MLEPDQIIVLIIIFLALIGLYREVFMPPTIFFLAVSVLTIIGILSPEEALSGFANEQVAVIILLLVLASAIKKSSLIDIIFNKVFHTSKGYKSFLIKMLAYVSTSSAFLNNTPIVATLIPYVNDWGKKHDIAPSKLLIPLSFAAILGGTATLIGTSTNLIVNGLAIESGLPGFNIFDFSLVGIPIIILGGIYIIFFGHKLLPDKKDALESFSEKSREYIVETIVHKKSTLIGKTIDEADLRNLSGLFLVEIVRRDKIIAPVSPEVIIIEGDTLIFAGAVDTITDLLKSTIGLSLPEVSNINNKEKTEVIEAVVPYNSSLIGKSVKKTDFRSRYDAAIVAIHRNGERISGKIGDIEVKPGDLLLLVAGEDFKKRTEDSQNIYAITKVRELVDINYFKIGIIGVGLLVSIILASTGVFPLFLSLLILLGLLAIFKILTLPELKNSLDLNIVFIAAFAIAIGKALIKTGTADLLAQSISLVFHPFGPIGILVGVYLVTNILTEFITNAAAASIVFPVAYASAVNLGMNPMPYVMAVAFGASASFLTPIGYQTNLMVLGPGNYNFKDFARVGLPLSILYFVLACLLISWKYNLI